MLISLLLDHSISRSNPNLNSKHFCKVYVTLTSANISFYKKEFVMSFNLNHEKQLNLKPKRCLTGSSLTNVAYI